MSELNFENLKQEIAKESQNCDIEKIKQFFVSVINSRRSLSKVKTLNDVFNLLERRYVLHRKEVTILQYMGVHFKNNKIVQLVKGYAKLNYLDTQACLCGSTDVSFKLPDLNEQTKSPEECVEKAIINVAKNIGKHWKVLARELDVKESHIDEITLKYPTDFHEQALQALLIWKCYKEDRATTEVLKTAIQSRLCKMRGIGLHLLQPAIKIE